MTDPHCPYCSGSRELRTYPDRIYVGECPACLDLPDAPQGNRPGWPLIGMAIGAGTLAAVVMIALAWLIWRGLAA